MILSTQRFKNCFHRIAGNEYFTREWLSPSRNCLHSNGGFWAKSMRNTGQGGRLETIFPEIFFDIVTGGCIFNP